MSRRTKQQICQAKKSERQKVYRKRKELLNQLSGVSGVQAEEINAKILRVNRDLAEINAYLFKCGATYAKAKQKRLKLKRRVYYLKSKNKSGDLSVKELNKNHKEMVELQNKIREMDAAMGKKVVVVKGRIQIIEDTDTGEKINVTTVWEAKAEFLNLVLSQKYSAYIIDGERFSASDIMGIETRLDQFVEDVFSRQHLTSTPMLVVVENPKNDLASISDNTI